MKKRVVAIDAETDPFLHGRAPKPFIWGFFDGENFGTFENAGKLARVLRDNDLVAYAHNGGKFDFVWLLDYADAGQKLRIINGRLAEFRIGKSILRDSFCIYPQKLATVDKGEIDYAKFEADVRGDHLPEITRYLERDCRSLHKIVATFRENYGPKLTLAGAAMAHWQGMGHEIHHATKSFDDIFRRFYFGGRVECFQRGIFREKIESWDIVSAFPHAMTRPQPWGLSPLALNKPPARKNWGQCFFRLQAPSRGQFPLREKSGLSFPHDAEIREFFVTGWELDSYLTAWPGDNVEIMECYHFQETMIFDDYVDYFFQLKKTAPKKSAEREIAKLFLNSLYGKFSSNPDEYQDYTLQKIGSPEPAGYQICGRSYPWDFFSRDLEPEEKQRSYYNVATGAGITGFVRARLYAEFVRQFGREFWRNKKLYYADTDCIHGDGVGLVESKNLGGWERDFCAARAAYAGKKMYSLIAADGTEKNRCKGANLSCREIFSVAAGKTVTWKSPAPTISVMRGFEFLERKIKMT